MKKNNASDIVTPFDWQRYTAATDGARTPAAARRPKKALTVGERVERILAHRWGSPYSKPGAA
jgi:hypothetical protein